MESDGHMNQVRLVNVSKDFGVIHALTDVTLTFPRSTVTAVVGENGAGKSTLMKILMGVVQPDRGTIFVDDRAVALTAPTVSRRLGFSAVFQEPLVFPYLSVLENLFLGQWERTSTGNLDLGRMREKARPVFDQLGLPENLLDRPMRSLSLGLQQLVLIAQALLYQSQLIIFDEPTAMLSAQETDHLFRIIRDLKHTGHIILYVSHRLDELSAVADRAVVLTDGQVVAVYDTNTWSLDELVEKMSGHRSDHVGSAKRLVPPTADGPAVLQVEGLTSQPVFHQVSFDVKSSEIVGFYGQVGAGRSEVMQAIFGMRPVQAGRILLNHQPFVPHTPKTAMEHGIAYLPEDRRDQGLFLPQSLTRNILVGGLAPYQSRWGWLNVPAITRAANRFIERLSVKTPSPDVPVGSLSGGGQQKILFARWLSHQGMAVMIFDEPTRGIDVATKDEIHDLLRSLAQDGMAVIVISSDLSELLALSTRIYVMRDGTIVDHFFNQGDLREPVLRASIGLDNHRETEVHA
jgi:ABC-type sugar transport system ATPase subunit